MAWTCSGRTNAELIQNMLGKGIISSSTVGKAMAQVDRAKYVPVKDRNYAYEDSPQPIGYGATISAPHMHAYATENLLSFLQPGARVLDVGSGSGYLTAIFHHLVTENGSQGKVVGIEHITELVDRSKANLRQDGLGEAIDQGRLIIVDGDGREGLASEGPYNAIHVGAAAPTMPEALIDQLAQPGRMFIPVGTHSQSIIQVDKDENGTVTRQKIMDVRYVPLTDRPAKAD